MVYTKRREPSFLAWLTLALLCGLRPEEASQTTWNDIDLQAGAIRVDAAVSKVRHRRIVHPQPAALAWLALAKEANASLPITRSTRRRYLRRLRRLLGLPAWPHDCLRHSTASYWLAAIQDAGKVVNQLGTSANILLKHYRELVTPSEAARVWAMMPLKAQRASRIESPTPPGPLTTTVQPGNLPCPTAHEPQVPPQPPFSQPDRNHTAA